VSDVRTRRRSITIDAVPPAGSRRAGKAASAPHASAAAVDTVPLVERDVALIVNPAAGGGRALRALPGAERALRDAGLRVRLAHTRDIEHARALGRATGAAGEVAAALGGDGLVGAVADGLRETAGSEPARPGGLLAILPGGRGNDFARTLAIPRDPVDAAALVANGRERAIDLGVCGSRAFVGIASCGFDSDANRIANDTRVPGDAAYVYGALRALAGWRPARFELELDGEPVVHVGYSVAAANGRQYGGGMLLAPDASLEDGLLDVVTVAAVPKRRFLRGLPRVFSGRHVRNEEVTVRRARELRIAADRPFTLYADGDPLAELPATVGTLPAAVRVIVP
jgi:YegS/Rv2252/BmrU family lipid kinase